MKMKKGEIVRMKVVTDYPVDNGYHCLEPHETFRAPKGKVVVAMVLGSEPTEGPALDIEAAMLRLGWVRSAIHTHIWEITPSEWEYAPPDDVTGSATCKICGRHGWAWKCPQCGNDVIDKFGCLFCEEAIPSR